MLFRNWYHGYLDGLELVTDGKTIKCDLPGEFKINRNGLPWHVIFLSRPPKISDDAKIIFKHGSYYLDPFGTDSNTFAGPWEVPLPISE
ncbi:MAG: hypothetical protein GX893_02840 [Firmicutes bacterium]|nr:hypothetical protein [Bacillota bacterium]